MKLLFPVIKLNKEHITHFGIFNVLEISFNTGICLNHCTTHAIFKVTLLGFGLEYKWRYDDTPEWAEDYPDDVS